MEEITIYSPKSYDATKRFKRMKRECIKAGIWYNGASLSFMSIGACRTDKGVKWVDRLMPGWGHGEPYREFSIDNTNGQVVWKWR